MYNPDKLEIVYKKIGEYYLEQERLARLGKKYYIRLGQFLMNELQQNSVNPDIFYEVSNERASAMFIEAYCTE